MVSLKAITECFYEGRTFKPGERFDVAEGHDHVLTTLGRACIPEDHARAVSVASIDAPKNSTRRYKRRDLQAS